MSSFNLIIGCVLGAVGGWLFCYGFYWLTRTDHVGKEIVRWLIWPYAIMTGGEFKATCGTRWFRFLEWLYGPGEEEFHCILPSGSLSPPLDPDEKVKWPNKNPKS